MVRLQENDILLYHPGVGAWYGDGKTLSIRTKAGELMVRRKEIDTLPYHGRQQNNYEFKKQGVL